MPTVMTTRPNSLGRSELARTTCPRMTGDASEKGKSGACWKRCDLDAAIDGAAGGAGVGREGLAGSVHLGDEPLGGNTLGDEVGANGFDPQTSEAPGINLGSGRRGMRADLDSERR